MKKNVLVLGAIRGRHEMPVKDYIFNSAIEDVTNLNAIYAQVEKKIGDNVDSVVLYVTGLTVVTTTVIKFCIDNGIKLTLKHFDFSSDSYYSQVII